MVDQSASGSTLYIEPEEIQVIQGKIEGIKWTEELEEEQVLMYLTGLIENEQSTINISVETMLVYDCLFAKAKYSEQINGTKVKVNESHRINLIEAKHPLLTDPVPLNLTLGNGVHALVITGPNTGGKTVTIKTVGILTLMTQCGFHIPVQEGSEISIYQSIYVDIGDGQSIEENLSTFSSRLVNVIDILRKTNDRSLVLVDELGSGTDPSEGMGLAISILDELYEKGATILATTHFNEMKKFAINRKGFLNGSMEFDLEKLQPTYQLLLGETGNSQAFEIALKLGLHQKLIEKAHFYTYGTEKSFKQTNAKEDTSQLALNRYVKRETKEMDIKENKVILRVGDSVRVKATDEIGIVYKAPNEKGEIIIQVKGEKRTIQEKRIELFIAKEELYPDDYDFDIIFKSVDYRKNSKLLNKRHTPGLEINSED
nr:hypothetical protein [Bacillus coahuilensis]